MSGYEVRHDPDGYAPNMGYTVVSASGTVLYRGPEWRATMNAARWNAEPVDLAANVDLSL